MALLSDENLRRDQISQRRFRLIAFACMCIGPVVASAEGFFAGGSIGWAEADVATNTPFVNITGDTLVRTEYLPLLGVDIEHRIIFLHVIRHPRSMSSVNLSLPYARGMLPSRTRRTPCSVASEIVGNSRLNSPSASLSASCLPITRSDEFWRKAGIRTQRV